MGDDRLIDGKYRLEDIEFSTDQAVTYHAQHIGIEREVVVKILAPERPVNGPDAARLLRESRVAGSVTHRNIQSVVDSGVHTDGRPFIVFEALKGKTIAELIADNPQGLDQERASRITVQLVEALAAFHSANLVHRAVGPDCAVVAELRGRDLVKLRHFQDAVLKNDDDRDALTMRPPPEYIPPELVGGGRYDERADLFGAGVIYRALLTGSPRGSTSQLNDTVCRAIRQATAKVPEERFSEADPLLLVLSIILGDRPGRDEVPSDALAADLGYLKLRRPTRISHHEGNIPTRAVGEAKLELLAVLLVIEAIYKELGPRWRELVARVPTVEELLPGSGNTDTNRQRGVDAAMFADVLAAVDEIAGSGDLALVARLGERVGQRGFARLSPPFAEAKNPDELLAAFPDLWSTLSRQGEVEVKGLGPGASTISIRHQVVPRLELTALAAGMLRGALLKVGATDARIQMPTCEALGDAATIYRVRWDPW